MATDGPKPDRPSLPHRRKPSSSSTTNTFDISSTYHSLLQNNPAYTAPVAAITALIALLNAQPASTVMETMDLLRTHVRALLTSVRNPVPLTAGTDLFQYFIVKSLKEQEDERQNRGEEPSADGGFGAMREQLVKNSEVYAARAILAREELAKLGAGVVRRGATVLTFGASRAVLALLLEAARRRMERCGSVDFRVVYVLDPVMEKESRAFVKDLRGEGIPVAEIPQAGVAHVLGLRSRPQRVDLVLSGAEAIPQSGGIYSKLGTAQVAALAAQKKVPFYVAAETHKFVRMFALPLGQEDEDLGFEQGLLDFTTDAESKVTEDPIDYTPPEHITKLITENGIFTASYPLHKLTEVYGTMISDDVIDRVHLELRAEGIMR